MTATRFLVSDVDGTLVDADKNVTDDARAAVRELKAAGLGFAFVSSRPPRGLASIAEALELPPAGPEGGPAAAAFNGGALLDANLKPISFTPLDPDDARIAVELFASMNIDTWVFTLDAWKLTDAAGHYVTHEQHTVGFAPTLVERFDDLAGIGKIVGSSADPDLLERARAALATKLSPQARALLSQSYYLDVTHAEANKGAALRAIAAHAGCALDEMAAIGDMVNDLAMLEIAGFSIAMGNAPDAVKAATDAVTASNRDEGFAKAVRDLVIPRAARASTGKAPMNESNRTRRSVEVVPDVQSLATRGAEWLVGQIDHAIEKRGRAVIALSGGSTPRFVFECLAEPPWRDRVAWERVHFVWGDERFVAADDEASNALMAKKALLDRVDVPASHIYPMPPDEPGPGVDPHDVDAAFERARTAATLYATTLKALHGGDRLVAEQPLFDVVMLGIGDDGHTASLFPGTAALDEREAWVVALKSDNATAPVRITLTYPVLESTHALLFLVAGESKRAMTRRVLDGDETLPAGRVRPVGGCLWILDEAAAGRPVDPNAPH